MVPTDICTLIRELEERIESVPEGSREFVRQMAVKANRYGDIFDCSHRQRMYLLSLFRQVVGPEEKNKPKSKLDELRERKAKILKKQHKQRARVTRAAELDTAGVITALAHAAQDGVTARMRHDRSISRQLHKNPLLKTGTSRS